MNTINLLHAVIRRNLFWLERLLIASGLTALLGQLLTTQRVYPIYWDTVVLAGVFLSLLLWPTIGYFVLILAALYPLGSISIYLAVLFLAIALIGQPWFIPNLGLVTLTLSAPFLNGIYLAWLVPLLGGLWWGPRGGLFAGLIAAAWGKMLFGLIGLPPDWLKLAGLYPDLGPTLLRFRGLDSLQVLTVIAAPLTPNSTDALYHTLQITIWAFTGWCIGQFSLKNWVQYQRPRASLALLTAGVALLSGLHILLFVWLSFSELPPVILTGLLPTASASLLAGILAELTLYFFEHPWSMPARASARASSAAAISLEPTAPLQSFNPASSGKPHTETPPKEDEEKLIMIELD